MRILFPFGIRIFTTHRLRVTLGDDNPCRSVFHPWLNTTVFQSVSGSCRGGIFWIKSRPMPQMTLIYDGDCGFCCKWVDRLRKRDVNQAIEFLSFQSPERERRYPGIQYDEFQKGGYLYFPDNRFVRGADAAPYILRVLPSWKIFSYFFKIPGVPPISRIVYSWIARNRHRLGDRSCKVPPS